MSLLLSPPYPLSNKKEKIDEVLHKPTQNWAEFTIAGSPPPLAWSIKETLRFRSSSPLPSFLDE